MSPGESLRLRATCNIPKSNNAFVLNSALSIMRIQRVTSTVKRVRLFSNPSHEGILVSRVESRCANYLFLPLHLPSSYFALCARQKFTGENSAPTLSKRTRPRERRRAGVHTGSKTNTRVVCSRSDMTRAGKSRRPRRLAKSKYRRRYLGKRAIKSRASVVQQKYGEPGWWVRARRLGFSANTTARKAQKNYGSRPRRLFLLFTAVKDRVTIAVR